MWEIKRFAYQIWCEVQQVARGRNASKNLKDEWDRKYPGLWQSACKGPWPFDVDSGDFKPPASGVGGDCGEGSGGQKAGEGENKQRQADQAAFTKNSTFVSGLVSVNTH